MTKLKPNQIPEKKAKEWLKTFDKLKQQIKLNFRTFFIARPTWEVLSGVDNLKRIRVYFGLETGQSSALSLCAYAVSTVFDDHGIYRDQSNRIFKLEPVNVDCSEQMEEVIRHIKAWNDWRAGETEAEEFKTNNSQQLFPAAFLLQAADLNELFSIQGLPKVKLEFGLEERINLLTFNDMKIENMIISAEYFDFQEPCPPVCDFNSPFIT